MGQEPAIRCIDDPDRHLHTAFQRAGGTSAVNDVYGQVAELRER